MKHDSALFDPISRATISGMIAVILLIITPVALQYYVLDARPVTMIGEEGLMQVHAYLMRFCMVGVLRIMVYLAGLLGCIAFIAEAVKHHRSIIHMMLAPILFTVLIGLLEPTRSYVDVQGERFSDIPMIHAFQLLAAVEKDMETEPELFYSSVSLTAEMHNYSYSTTGKHSHRITVIEYSLNTANGSEMFQISASDHKELSPYVGEYTTHKVMCYPNSGLLYSIDDGEKGQTNAEAEKEYYASQFTLTYDEDGYLRWTPESFNLSLIIQVDGEQTMMWNAAGESEYKPLFYEGHINTAYLVQVIDGSYTLVSNIITVTEPYIPETTEYVPPEFTRDMTDNGDGTIRCTVQPYGVSIDLPEYLIPVCADGEVTTDISGADCDLFESSPNDYMLFKMWWEYSPYLASTEWGLEDRGQNYFGEKYEGSYYKLEPLEGFDDAYTMLVSPGRSDMPAYYLYAIVKVDEKEYIKLCIAYPNSSQGKDARSILDTLTME